MMCRVLDVSRSGYYGWLHREPSATARRRTTIAEAAKQAFEENYGEAGYRPIHEQLNKEGIECCPETVRKVLKKQGLAACVAPKFVPQTTDSDHNLPVAENLLDRDFTASRPNEKWTSDITYNAPSESFFGKLKTGWVHRQAYATREEAMRSIYFYIEMYYNSKRRHSTLGYLSPNDFESKHRSQAS